MQVKSDRMKLKGLNNTRDLGGLPAEGGKIIAHGKLIRSGKLYNLPKKTVEKLREHGVGTVIDLRIGTERDEKPDTIWEGLNYYNLPVLCTATPGITREKSMRVTMVKEGKRIKSEFGSGENYMAEMYRIILLQEEPKQMLAKVLRLIIDSDGCVLFHCSSGKDRAGIVAMLVESLLGVEKSVILQDYMASRRHTNANFFVKKLGLIIAPCTIATRKILYAMMATKPRFILDAIKTLEEKYGSVINYCKAELGITDQDILTMRQKYLI